MSKNKTSKELSVMLSSYENARELASIISVLIRIARMDGFLAINDYNLADHVKLSLESLVLSEIIGYIVKGCVASTNDLKGTIRVLMNYHGISQEVERKVLMTGLIGLIDGESLFLIKGRFEEILTKDAKKIQYAIKRFLKTKVIENESLIREWCPEEVEIEQEVDGVLSQDEIMLLSDIGGENVDDESNT